MRLRFHLLVLGLISLLLAPFVVPVFSLWSRINCREQEVDVLSGLRRDTRYIYWIRIDRKISETSISKALSVDASAKNSHRWEPVNTFGPYTRHSPHYSYHAAFSQIWQLQLIWDEYESGVVQRQGSAQGLLREWQNSGTDSTADDYLQEQTKIAEKASESDDDKPPIECALHPAADGLYVNQADCRTRFCAESARGVC
jgi:hypothetical protein